MLNSFPPLQKASFLGCCAVGMWAFTHMMGSKEVLRSILQPLVLAFMFVGVLSLLVEWVEFPLKFALRCVWRTKRRVVRKGIGKGDLLQPLSSTSTERRFQLRTEWYELLAIEAVQTSPLALQYAPETVRNNDEVVLEAVKKNPQALWYASSRLRDTEEHVAEAVERNGMVLACVSERLRAQDDIVRKAIKQNGRALQYVSKDPEHVTRPGLTPFQKSRGRFADLLEHVEEQRRLVNADIPSRLPIRIIAVIITLFTTYHVLGHLIWLFWEQLKEMDTDPFIRGIQHVQEDIMRAPWVIQTGINVTEWSDPNILELKIKGALNVVSIATSIGATLFSTLNYAIMCTIYSLILLVAPVKEISSVFDTVRSYFARKTASNLVYTTIAFAILHHLHNPLTPLIAVFTFFISYIPEIGAFITCVLPAPIFLLDGDLPFGKRITNCLWGLFLMILNKFAVGNGFEAVIMGMGSAGSQERQKPAHIHPVLMIIIVLFGGALWGATGTLFAVPATWLIQAYAREEIRQWECHTARETSTNKAATQLLAF